MRLDTIDTIRRVEHFRTGPDKHFRGARHVEISLARRAAAD
ncbi:MAG: hypothetical protein ACREQJ_14880 [Candidatus Binatia bacterium]